MGVIGRAYPAEDLVTGVLIAVNLLPIARHSPAIRYMPNQPANAKRTKMSRHTKPALRIQVSAPGVDYRPLFPPE